MNKGNVFDYNCNVFNSEITVKTKVHLQKKNKVVRVAYNVFHKNQIVFLA
jgi:hypothetical protein